RGQPEGEAQAAQDGGGQEVVGDHVPLEGVVADDGEDGERKQDEDDGGRDASADTAAGHDAQDVGGGSGGGSGRGRGRFGEGVGGGIDQGHAKAPWRQ